VVSKSASDSSTAAAISHFVLIRLTSPSDRSPDRPQDTRAAGPGILVHITPAIRRSGEGGGFTGFFRHSRRFKRGHSASAGQDASNTAATTKTHSATTTPCLTTHHPFC